MSDNIVKELRESKIALHSTAHKAADEIDKLREELEAYDKTIKEHCDETTRLRADLAAVKEERDRMREALKPFAKLKPVSWSLAHDMYHISTDDITAARAVLESVTEPTTGDSNA